MASMTLDEYSQGGLSDGYKNHIAENQLPDETYKEHSVALFRVQGSGPENMQAIQVEPVRLLLLPLSFHIFKQIHAILFRQLISFTMIPPLLGCTLFEFFLLFHTTTK